MPGSRGSGTFSVFPINVSGLSRIHSAPDSDTLNDNSLFHNLSVMLNKYFPNSLGLDVFTFTVFYQVQPRLGDIVSVESKPILVILIVVAHFQ